MKLGLFLKEKLYFIVPFLIFILLFTTLLIVFQVPIILVILFLFFALFLFLWTLIFEYARKYTFYQELTSHIKELEQAYYVLETINRPDFYEGELIYQALYDINKSMCEYTKSLRIQKENFQAYIEMWIHEVKIPIASLMLFAHNHKESLDKKVMEQLKKIDDQIEQVLYYARCENAEKDYLIKEVPLKKIISSVLMRNKNDLLENKMDLKVEIGEEKVLTDAKWLEFILNQIISNSMKYKRNTNTSYLKIETIEKENQVTIVLTDNGIGIPKEDLPRVFDQSFTGRNGRKVASSTGMGLFIVKNLCEKLGHKIEIQSKVSSFTKVFITISKDSYYDDVL